MFGSRTTVKKVRNSLTWFSQSVKLLQFALRVASASGFAKELTDDDDALRQAIRPLVMNLDCHFLAVLTVLVQSILEGRTDCPISFFFLQCRTSTRHGRSTTGNGKDW